MLTYLNYDLSVNPLEYERISSMLLGDDVVQKDSLLSVWFPPQTSEDQLLGSTHNFTLVLILPLYRLHSVELFVLFLERFLKIL